MPPIDSGRQVLVSATLDFLGGQDLITLQEIRVALEHELDHGQPETMVDLKSRLTIGEPFQTDALLARSSNDRRIAMDAIGIAVAELVPLTYRGVYRDPDQFPELRDVVGELRCAR